MPPGEQIRCAALRCFQYRRLGLLPALWALAFAAGQGRGGECALLCYFRVNGLSLSYPLTPRDVGSVVGLSVT
jgi:hypothetical protein